MGVLQTIIATVGSIGGGGTPPPPPTGSTSWIYSSDANAWASAGVGAWGYNVQSAPAPDWASATWANGNSGHTLDFNGSAYIFSPYLTGSGAWPAANEICIQVWFYPTSYGTQVLGMLQQQDFGSPYHTSLVEVNSSGNLVARVWPYSQNVGAYPAVTSSGTVTLNAWNHAYVYCNSSNTLHVELNGIYAGESSGYSYGGPGSSSTVLVVGMTDSTNMGSSGAFQGKIGAIEVYDYVASNNYQSQKSKYIPLPTAYTLGSAVSISGNNWNGSTIVGGYSTWPPGAPYAGTGVIMNNGTYLSLPVTLSYESWTIEMVAELSPQGYWATIWGAETFSSNTGYIAFFDQFSTDTAMNIGSPSSYGSVTVAGARNRAMWTFVNSYGTVSLYKNGTLVGNATGAAAPSNGSGNINVLIGARHGNNGVGVTDNCNLTLYYAAVYDGALIPSAITDNYNAIKDTYGLPTD